MSSALLAPSTMATPSLPRRSSSTMLQVPSHDSRPSSPALSTASTAVSSDSEDRHASLERSKKRTRSAWDIRSLSRRSSSTTLQVPSPDSRPSSPAFSTTSTAVSSDSDDKHPSLERSKKRTRSVWDIRSLSRSSSPPAEENANLNRNQKKRSFMDLHSFARSPSPAPSDESSSSSSSSSANPTESATAGSAFAEPAPAESVPKVFKHRLLSPERLGLPKWLGGTYRPPKFTRRRLTARTFRGDFRVLFSTSWLDEDWNLIRRERSEMWDMTGGRSYHDLVTEFIEPEMSVKEKLERAREKAVWEVKDMYRFYVKRRFAGRDEDD